MKRRITITLLTLSLLLGLALWSQGRAVTAAKAMQAVAYPLNPNNFTSLGASPFSSGTYTIDASIDNAAPRLLQGATVIATGVFHDPDPTVGVVRDEIAVFTFDSIIIPAGVTVQGARNANSRPIALLSKTLISIDGVLDVSGADGIESGVSGAGGTGGAAGPGGGGGGGGGVVTTGGGNGGVGLRSGAHASLSDGGDGANISVSSGGSGGVYSGGLGGGGAFGGNGGTAAIGVPHAAGGTAYGDLAAQLQGGSGGGGAGGNSFTGYGGGGGGGGGGGLEVGAVASIVITGSVRTNGGDSAQNRPSGGGGAGGGIFIHGQTVLFSGAGGLSATGGASRNGGGNGGGGGGGRVLIAAIIVTEGCFNVAGGNGNSGGSPGVVTMVGTIINRLPAAGLAFEQQPTGTTLNATISPAVLVRILDRCGNPMVSSTATVTLALGNNPGGATLGGTLSRSAIAGVATFSNLSLNKPGAGYTLIASSSGLSGATSSAFNITCQAITVNPSTTTIPGGTVGTSFSQNFTQTGGNGTISWSISPSIPGLSLDSTGRLFGTPTVADTFNFTVTATDGNGCPGSRAYSLTINCPTIDLTPTTLAAGTVGAAYPSTTLLPSGGTSPYDFTVNGLPLGLTAVTSSTSVVISGTPLRAGSFIVRVDVRDAYGCMNGNSGRSYALSIAKGTPVITWNNPADITYGTALSNPQLNATANVAGAFTYTPAGGTVLNVGTAQSLSVNFTPGDTANYNTASKSVSINVVKATPVITWNNPANIVYGVALSSTQLNASATVAGSFSYTPPSGTALNVGNGQSLSVTFTPADAANYNPASKSVAINVVKATPVITWNNPADIVYGTALSALQLNATANVSGSFAYTPAVGTVLNAGNGQTLTVNFTPTDTANYNTTSKSVTINVLKATPVLTWNNPAGIVYGTALSNGQLNATANVSGSFAYTPAVGTVLNTGNGQILSVLFTPTNSTNYNNATRSVTINVLKATPMLTWNLPAFFVEGSQLSAANLNATANVPGTFSYTPPAGTVLTAGPLTLTANFTPTDTANYNPTSLSVLVPVLYNFSGFLQPVDNAPMVNAVTAGSSIPVKFSLSGNKGLNIFAAGYPQSAQIACTGGTPDDIEETVTAGASSLSYDATTDRYNYVWKTDKAWKGTCRKLILKFNDGSTREALFQFR